MNHLEGQLYSICKILIFTGRSHNTDDFHVHKIHKGFRFDSDEMGTFDIITFDNERFFYNDWHQSNECFPELPIQKAYDFLNEYHENCKIPINPYQELEEGQQLMRKDNWPFKEECNVIVMENDKPVLKLLKSIQDIDKDTIYFIPN